MRAGAGINEDPVTGSAHTTLARYWCHRLGKQDLLALQASEDGGLVHCTLAPNDRVILEGGVVEYSEQEHALEE